MKANTKYNRRIADGYHDTKYYECNEYNIRNQEFLNSEKNRLKTNNKENVTRRIQEERFKGFTKQENVFQILKNIYEKNKEHVFENEDIEATPHNSDLLNLVSDESLLISSYAKVRKNPGSTALAYKKTDEEQEKLTPEQKRLLEQNEKGVDGIKKEDFHLASILIKKGQYPWGTSKRIYIDKPGKPGVKRLLTIPPFMDRVVQESIRQVLATIYEPVFDKMHVSFGFRPNRGVHDSIHLLTNRHAEALYMALEGDIKSAYDKVNRKKLIQILGKRIKDKKFLKFIEQRLDYEYYDTEKDIYVKDKDGIPQGGTDSPYLWNIYMLEFDIFIEKYIQRKIKTLNLKNRGDVPHEKKFINTERSVYASTKATIIKILNWIRKIKKKKNNFKTDLKKLNGMNLKDWKEVDPIFAGSLRNAKSIMKDCKLDSEEEKTIIKILQRKAKKMQHLMNNLPYSNPNKKRFRILYTRYADDWIILTNLPEIMLLELKIQISTFLKNTLYAILSDDKTLITNITIKPAHFLGFEIRTYREMKIEKKMQYTILGKRKMVPSKVAGYRVFAGIDKQRLIDRLYIKGYCEKTGQPREISKLNNLEVFTIIDRTNSVLVGITNFYANFIRNPKSELSRWIYIIRFSCLKTLAQKYKTTIRDIMTTFQPENLDNYKETETIEETVIMKVNNENYSKTWRLHTIQSLMSKCRGKNQQLNKKEIVDRYWNFKGKNPKPFDHNEKTKDILIKNSDFLERINWVNIRTKASLDLPCCICGCEKDIEMHHVKHVRKVKYNNINKEKTWEQIMGLRNRRQIPVCRTCHMVYIHKGKYRGESLKGLSIDKMYDNRIINSESYIHKGNTNVDYTKSLSEKGWVRVQEKEDIL